MERYTIGFASDHAGFALKEQLVAYLLGEGYSVKDFGAYSPERSDYPDFAHPLAEAIVAGECRFGVTICWTGNGINMVMNRHAGVRSAICLCEEMARLARNHNDANSCSIAAKYVEPDAAQRILDVFLSEGFEGGRHETRVQKIELRTE
jgi:ribose 5-phosphate isomerase B